MKVAKRVFLMFAVNILVMIMITTVISALGLSPYVTSQGLDMTGLALFCLLWGFAGAFISLWMSRWMAKKMMGVQIIEVNTNQPEERWLIQTVHQLAQKAGMRTMPEVGYYDSPEVNAFATGPTQARSLVAVSSGLLRAMSREEAEGVLAHEVAHIVNGDMVTMTLIQGVVNAFVMFFARIVGWAAGNAVDEEKAPLVRFITTIVFEIAFAFLGMFVVAYFSRQREFRADAGGAKLAGRGSMIGALKRLQQTIEATDNSNPSLATLKISTKKGRGIMALISTHPPLETRIAALERARL